MFKLIVWVGDGESEMAVTDKFAAVMSEFWPLIELRRNSFCRNERHFWYVKIYSSKYLEQKAPKDHTTANYLSSKSSSQKFLPVTAI